MSYVFGGLILKNANNMNDHSILQLLKRENYIKDGAINMEDAFSSQFDGVGIARVDEMAIIPGIDIPHGCSFANEPLSPLDQRLEKRSESGDVLCFSVNGIMNTYAFAIYKNGKRVRVKGMAGDKILSDEGKETNYDHNIEFNESGLKKLIEHFTGYDFSEMVFDMGISVSIYHER